MNKRELERLSDRQLWQVLARITRIFWERQIGSWPEESLETLTSACEEIEEMTA